MDWPEPPPGKELWDPPGRIEVYVHSGLSEAYGVDETVGMDKVVSEDNIRRARACREIGAFKSRPLFHLRRRTRRARNQYGSPDQDRRAQR